MVHGVTSTGRTDPFSRMGWWESFESTKEVWA